MNRSQLLILRHALGLREDGSGRAYREHFVTGTGSTDYEDCEALLASGHMTKRTGSALSGGEPIYLVTEAGPSRERAPMKTPRDPFAIVTPPRSVFGTGTYTGAELSVRPVRAGATDAYRMPSLINGRRVEPAELRAQLAAPLHTYTPPPAAAAPESTRKARPKPMRRAPGSGRIPIEHRNVKPLANFPRNGQEKGSLIPGSVPSRLIAYLREHGGHMMFADIVRRFELHPGTLDSCLRKAISNGHLIRMKIGHFSAAALPGYVLPANAHAEAEKERLARYLAAQAKRRADREALLRAAQP